MKSPVFFALLILITSACTKSSLDGIWDDNIKLSAKEINLSAHRDSVSITTEGSWWWIDGIGLDDNWNYQLDEIDTTKDNFTIEEADFRIERIEGTAIHILMEKNETGAARVLKIALQAGDYFDAIQVTQASE
ncbi:hypothetical protein LAG90_02540 [Marinilongibacter aquaticus]|uniref:hypothetical protein n=1 Tax=Marinilongibacter aquaticus TaxID=2975157 RepID=UPI0021BDC7C8|nr:hypothetical protein [Marinilongibacter aquaticus]UBM59533.1 hypothetical protein LAG90_02540 [Marinilongibacter aquaticus]